MQFLNILTKHVLVIILFTGSLVVSDNKDYVADTPITVPAITLSAKDMKCLVENVYQEAASESAEGKIAVALVTINRMLHMKYPGTICAVVYQPGQFTWTFTNKIGVDKRVYEETRRLVEYTVYMYDNIEPEMTNGAIFYHANYVSPSWKNKLQKVTTIGRHVFYKEKNHPQLNRLNRSLS